MTKNAMYVRDKRRYLRVPGTKLRLRVAEGMGFSSAFNHACSSTSDLGDVFFNSAERPMGVKASMRHAEAEITRLQPDGVRGRHRPRKSTRRARKAYHLAAREDALFEIKLYRAASTDVIDMAKWKIASARQK